MAVSDFPPGLVYCMCLLLKASTILINGASLPIQFILWIAEGFALREKIQLYCFFFSLHINYCHEMKSIGNRYCKLSPTNNNESLTELKDSWFIIGGWLKQEIWAVEPGGFGGSVSSYIILPSMHDLKACHCSRREKCPIPTVYRALLKHVSMPALVKRESF